MINKVITKVMFILSYLWEYNPTELLAIAMIMASGEKFFPHLFLEAVRITAKTNHPILIDGTVCTKIYPGDEDWVEMEYRGLLERATRDREFNRRLTKLFFREMLRELWKKN